MIRTVISHDTSTSKARIRFEHQGIIVEQNYSLMDVIPSTRYVFTAMGKEFTIDDQFAVIDKLEAMIQSQIENGALQNPPESVVPEPTPPPEPETGTPPGPAPEGE